MDQRDQPLGFWSYSEIKGHSMKSDQIIQDYEKFLAGNFKEADLNDGLLNSPLKDYPGLDQYPYSGNYVWIDNNWKLHQTGSTFQLYNLTEDPGEMTDLVEIHPQRVKIMKKELKAWLDSVVNSIRGEDYD